MTETSGPARNGRVIARFVEILTTNRLDALGEVLTEDIVQEIPQSGERVRGLENIRAVFANYPGQGERGLRTEQLQVLGEEPRYLMSPTFNLVRLEGSGDHPIAVLRSQYPDGSRWWVIVLITMRGERMAKQTTYFAPAFTPPEWRAAWVETMTDGESH